MEQTFGAYIRARREDLGFTSQVSLAREAGISSAHLNQIESGKIALPNADMRRKLADVLHVSHLDLLVAAGEITPEEAGYRPAPDTPAVLAVRAILESRDFTEKQIHQLAVMVRGMVEMMEG